MITLLIADDHALFREGLKQILAETPDMTVTGEASDGREVWDLLLKNHYDVILLDISMPGRNGIDVLRQIKSEKPEIPVLMLSMYPEEQYAIRALKAGASGYLTKMTASNELIEAIRRLAMGRQYISTSLAEKLALFLGSEHKRGSHQHLSDREMLVMCMIAEGKTVKMIADELALSIKTISTYRSRVLQKLGLTNNAEIIRYAIRKGLVS